MTDCEVETPRTSDRASDFTAEVGEYVVLKLPLADYTGTRRVLPPDFQLVETPVGPEFSADEKRLLKMYFRSWMTPYRRRLPGYRDDSPIYVVEDGRLVAGVYLCDKNEFDDDREWGQLHYAFADPSVAGRGIYSVIFRTAVERAVSWGLKGLYLNSDRHLLPDVYERWGARYWRTVSKPQPGALSAAKALCRRLIGSLLSMLRIR
ncbi:MAG: GNAT family N-acetyltransferase [Planctomycetota bacterium]